MHTTTTVKTARPRPWEKIGVPVPIEGQLKTSEALRLTNNDWGVDKVSLITSPNMVRGDDGVIDTAASENSDLFGIENPQMCMTVRRDTRSYLGTVGKNYGVVQNAQAVEFFDEALGAESACVTAVGSLGRYGARFFMIATLPSMLEVLPGEPIERHILLTNTHDGTGAVEAMFIGWDPGRDLMVHAPGGRVALRHTKNAAKRLRTAHKILCKNEQFWERAQRAYSYMAKREASQSRAEDLASALFPDIVVKDDEGNEIERRTSPQAIRKREQILGIFNDETRDFPQTDWGLYNSVATFVDHERKISKSHAKNGVSRWELSVFGPGATLRETAFRWLKANK